MSQALLRENLLMDLWSKKAISSTDPYIRTMLRDLHKREIVSGVDNPTLTKGGVHYVNYGREISELEELLEI